MQTIRKSLSFTFAIAFAVLAFLFAAQAQARPAANTVTAEQRVNLGLASYVTAPADATFLTVEAQQYGDQAGVKLVYEYAAEQTSFETRFVIVDLCSVLNGPVSGYRKTRISRLDLTNAYWDATGRTEPGTYAVCAYELIPR